MNHMPDQIVIPLSRTKIVLLLLGQISANALQIKFEDLLNVIAQFSERHKDA